MFGMEHNGFIFYKSVILSLTLFDLQKHKGSEKKFSQNYFSFVL